MSTSAISADPDAPPFFASLGAATHVGYARANNEDAAAYDESLGALVVCDGVGGFPGGEVAAATAARATLAALRRGASLLVAVAAAERAVAQAAHRMPSLAAMATTLVAAVPVRGGVELAWVGDSRAYACDGRKLRRLTVDQVAARDELVNALGAGLPGARAAGRVQAPLARGDALLLCSDGVSNYVTEVALRQILAAARDAPGTAARLVGAALAGGGGDNATALVALR